MYNSRRRNLSETSGDTIGSVRNYYEKLVFDELLYKQCPKEDSEFIADAACIALNHLPPRYIRHGVDMAFYLSTGEQQEMAERVVGAVKLAVESMRKRVAEHG